MKRWLTRGVPLVLIAFVTGGLLAYVFLLPRLAERKVEEVARDRHLQMDIGRVLMRGSSVRFEDVVICSSDCTEEDPLVVTVGLLKVTPDVASLMSGRPRPRSVGIEDARARIDLRHPDALSRLAAGTGALDGGTTTDSSRSTGSTAAPRNLPRVHGNGLRVDVIVSDDVRASFEDGQVLVDAPEGPPSLDLGRTRLEGPGFEVTARHVIVEMSDVGARSPVDSVRLIALSIVLDDDLPLLERGGEQAAEQPTPEAQEPSAVAAKLSSLLDGAELAARLSAVPDEVAAVLSGARIHVSGGSLHVPSTPRSVAMDFTMVKGSVALLQPELDLQLSLQGHVAQGPFFVSAEMDDRELRFDVDTPYVPTGFLGPWLPVPDSVCLDDARVMLDATGTVDRDTAGIVLDGTVAIDGLALDSSRIALEPVSNIHFSTDGHLVLDLAGRAVTLTKAEVDASGVPIHVDEAVLAKHEGGYHIRLGGHIPPTPCQELFNSLPFALRSSLPGFLFDGLLAAQLDVDMDWSRPDDAVMNVHVDNRCSVLSGGDLKLAKLNGTFVHDVEDKMGRHRFVMGPGSESWVDLEAVDEHMTHALVTCEDGAFYSHKGISGFAIKRAVKKNIKKGYFAYGASTITMQLVKNLFLSRDKTISRKLQEMILTWWIENSLDKDQIMELYLNVVEFGPAIYGIRNAALRYFGKHPSQLTVLECAFLAKMLPNPVSRYRYYQKGRSGLDPTWRKVLERVVGKMHERGYLDDSEYDQALASQLVFFYPDMVPPAREEGGNPMELVSAGTDIVHVPAGGDPAAQTGTAAGE
jgi:hypothetical protein